MSTLSVNNPVAFYAPLKAPTYPTPSGDQKIAQHFWQCLELCGWTPVLASQLRSFSRHGELKHQKRLARLGKWQANKLIKHYLRLPKVQRPTFWFTYHLYHKAPDWLGPRVSQALNIPYVIAEASVSEKQLHGPWRYNFRATLAALHQANAVISLNPKDLTGIQPYCQATDVCHYLPPFMALPEQADLPQSTIRQQLAQQYGIPENQPWLLSVAMVRPGDKLASYRYLLNCLQSLQNVPWQWIIIGEGQALNQLKKEANTLGTRIHWLGKFETTQITPWLQTCDLMAWPAINEALGMAILEAQMYGLPVITGATPGVCSLFSDTPTQRGGLIIPQQQPENFKHGVYELLTQPKLRQQLSQQAQQWSHQHHSLFAAAQQLKQWLTPLIGNPD
ncbi:glycosyltransferase family 4 protein [Zooshikella harenae]|uniref:Glycosyltransferase family 4 protein n=1 Tax=Zooshikella harenae TaxID=2827238 RepID=A0ABS5ZG39_9GAMM|nr:glycosyltransferase family 4 protein [Zooshikella harenae]MBU2713027.1 glycosyltransferase family 4 protein [Zooshikella harenae]